MEKSDSPVVVFQPAPRPGRLLSECIALAEKHEAEQGDAPQLDDAFGRDLEEISAGRREQLRSRWD